MFEQAEMYVRQFIGWVRLAIDLMSAWLIVVGVVLAIWQLYVAKFKNKKNSQAGFVNVRLTLATYLALGLELQLASDILSTAVSPTWTEIGKLSAIAALRTALNYFLKKEIESEQSDDNDKNGYSFNKASDHNSAPI